jgi:transglutaminase-like putative cysteine protease
MGTSQHPGLAGVSVIHHFAHIMISGMRGLGLPAAYVSGYLRTAQSAGQDRSFLHRAVSAWKCP